MQRFFDIMFATLAILFLLPFFILIIIALRFTGEGEIFYRQKRIGWHGKEFYVLKFATMLKDSANIGTGTVTLKNDPRVLRLGKVLRKTKLNELPQLINVLLGNMSLIGPRPQTQRCFEAFPSALRTDVVTVVPGLSGVGSIIFRFEEEMLLNSVNADNIYDNDIMPYKAQLEIWYTQNRNIKTYFVLIMLTLWSLFKSDTSHIYRILRTLPLPPDRLRQHIKVSTK